MTSVLLLAALSGNAFASSHREAPAISLDPSADITDFYAFLDPNDGTRVVFIMNVNPMELPGGGPNFHRFDDDVLYSIKVDNEGDAKEDVVFNFQFETTFDALDGLGLDTFLYNIGDVGVRSSLYQTQTYTVTRVDDGVSTTILSSGEVAPINVGTQSGSAGYSPDSSSPGAITTDYVTSSGNYDFFAGPRQEGFYVDLERTFDLLNLVGNDGTANQNTLLGYNVHSIAISLPVTAITKDGLAATTAGKNHVISTWATTSRRAVTVRRSDGLSSAFRGGWVQVARLGNPLVNEVVIPTVKKDAFNASAPLDDVQFLDYVQHLMIVDYMNYVLGTSCPTEYDAGLGFGGREDIILAFLTGHPALGNLPADYSYHGAIPGETGKIFEAFDALHINLEGSGAGFWPDGRYVSDDVVDTALSAVCGLLISGASVPDGVDSTGLSYLDQFPFLGDPWAGDDHPQGVHDEL